MRDPKPVKIWVQILISFFPFAWIKSLYNIGKLRLGLAVFIPSGIGLEILFTWLGFPPYTSLALNIVLWVVLIWKWSIDWNKKFTPTNV